MVSGGNVFMLHRNCVCHTGTVFVTQELCLFM